MSLVLSSFMAESVTSCAEPALEKREKRGSHKHRTQHVRNLLWCEAMRKRFLTPFS
jgi:hypothetical protein